MLSTCIARSISSFLCPAFSAKQALEYKAPFAQTGEYILLQYISTFSLLQDSSNRLNSIIALFPNTILLFLPLALDHLECFLL